MLPEQIVRLLYHLFGLSFLVSVRSLKPYMLLMLYFFETTLVKGVFCMLRLGESLLFRDILLKIAIIFMF